MKKNRVKHSNWKGVFFFVLVVLIVFAGWFWIFMYEDCKDKACFDEALKNCDRAKFIYGDGMIFEYTIRGEENGRCEVDVVLLQGDLNNADSMKLEGQKMTCMLPLGIVMDPERDIGNCHGMLKEGLQDLVIRKLHTYLVQNLGRLNLEMVDIPELGDSR